MNSILVYESNDSGHYPFFLELITKAVVNIGVRVVVATPHTSPAHLPEHVERIDTTPTMNPCEEAFVLAERYAVSDLFLCSLDTVLCERKAWMAYQKNSSHVGVHGIWIKPYKSTDNLFKRILSRGVRRRHAVLRGLHVMHQQKTLKTVFVLDDRLIQQSPLRPKLPLTLLPDPWRPFQPHTREAARSLLKLPQGRTILVHLGDDTRRKGLLDVLQCMRQLPEQSPLLLVRGGVLSKRVLKQGSLLQSLERSGRLICFNQWLSEEMFDLIMQAADYVLLPYHAHDGSSGVLSRAIGLHRPVIASDFGVIAARVRRYNLGYLYPHKNTAELFSLFTNLPKYMAFEPRFEEACSAFSPERFEMCMLQTLKGKGARGHASTCADSK